MAGKASLVIAALPLLLAGCFHGGCGSYTFGYVTWSQDEIYGRFPPAGHLGKYGIEWRVNSNPANKFVLYEGKPYTMDLTAYGNGTIDFRITAPAPLADNIVRENVLKIFQDLGLGAPLIPGGVTPQWPSLPCGP